MIFVDVVWKQNKHRCFVADGSFSLEQRNNGVHY